MTKETHNVRHGDIGLFGIDTVPSGLEASSDGILFSAGSGGHTHSFQGGTFYPKVDGDFVIGYLVAKDTTLFHPEHGIEDAENGLKKCSIPDGVYEVRRQVEDTPEGFKQVLD